MAAHRSIRIATCAALLLALGFTPSGARGHGSYGSPHSYRPYRYHAELPAPRLSRAIPGVPRDAHGRIARSESEKHDFMKESGYPHGRPGFVVDHVIPLARGGSDTPGNMQWQTTGEAKAKDKLELGPRLPAGSRSHHRH